MGKRWNDEGGYKYKRKKLSGKRRKWAESEPQHNNNNTSKKSKTERNKNERMRKKERRAAIGRSVQPRSPIKSEDLRHLTHSHSLSFRSFSS